MSRWMPLHVNLSSESLQPCCKTQSIFSRCLDHCCHSLLHSAAQMRLKSMSNRRVGRRGVWGAWQILKAFFDVSMYWLWKNLHASIWGMDCLLTYTARWERAQLSNCRSSESANSENDWVLHLEDWYWGIIIIWRWMNGRVCYRERIVCVKKKMQMGGALKVSWFGKEAGSEISKTSLMFQARGNFLLFEWIWWSDDNLGLSQIKFFHWVRDSFFSNTAIKISDPVRLRYLSTPGMSEMGYVYFPQELEKLGRGSIHIRLMSSQASYHAQ